MSLLLLDFIRLFRPVIAIVSALRWLQAGLGHEIACGVVSAVALLIAVISGLESSLVIPNLFFLFQIEILPIMGDIGQELPQTQLAEQSLSPEETDELSVLVTGFGVSS